MGQALWLRPARANPKAKAVDFRHKVKQLTKRKTVTVSLGTKLREFNPHPARMGGSSRSALPGTTRCPLLLSEWLPEPQTCGRVIVRPVLNPLAVEAWSRNTPLDGLNLNRVFPGLADESVTERVADAVSMADTGFVLHSFGPTWDFPPAATTHSIANPDLMARTVRMAEGFKLLLIGLGIQGYGWNVRYPGIRLH
ncbi:succinylglutamate desuccinylase/aspartoacylase family protein [Mesorhizobium sp. M1340]|uniref:succinylglutamate desuccinylase/aspartoacylase domain-containing protein n=1 Tax=Mesorhizobium sp. M1340 TaxID=2957087 RepID=UPI00333C1151